MSKGTLRKRKAATGIKTAVIVLILAIGGFTALRMPETIQSFLPRVETISVQSVGFTPSVTANGIIGKDESSWYAVVTVNEGDIPDIAVGQEAVFSGPALKNDIYCGKVKHISDGAYQKITGVSTETVVDVTIEITNGDDYLRTGYTVQAQIQTAPKKQILLLPYSAICQDDTGEYVYVLEKSTAKRKYITTGLELAEGAEIASGLRASEEVIAEPQNINPDSYVLKSEKS